MTRDKLPLIARLLRAWLLTTATMDQLQPIFKRAYWSLAAGGLLYVLFVFAMTFPEVQRLYGLSILNKGRMAE
jgi:hypothetical protein